MSERYLPSATDEHARWRCQHCGCYVWNRELHDRVNGLGYLDEGNAAMVSHMQAVGQQLAPPEPCVTTIVCFDCEGLGLQSVPCRTCKGCGLLHERLATPDEVDNGCELGIAYDPAPQADA